MLKVHSITKITLIRSVYIGHSRIPGWKQSSLKYDHLCFFNILAHEDWLGAPRAVLLVLLLT